MKIVYFVESFPITSETFILNQITGMMDKGHEVYILSWSRMEITKKHSIVDKYKLLDHTHYLDDLPKTYLLRIAKFISLILINLSTLHFDIIALAANAIKHYKKRINPGVPFLNIFNASILLASIKPDIIHCQFGSLGPRGLLLMRICNLTCKLITSFRGADATKYVKTHPGVYDDLFASGDLFLPVCHALEQRLIKLGCDENRTKVHYSGVDLTNFKYTKRDRTKNTHSKVNLLTVARLVEKKGVSFAIRASAHLVSLGYDIRHIIVGDGELRNELESLINSLEVDKVIQVYGWRNHDEIIQLLNDTHILVAPSITANDGDQEGIPNVIKEAMAMGIPVVSTSHGGIPELVEDGISGFLVPERDTDALADRIRYLIDHPDKWDEMGYAGRKHIEADFDIEKLNDQLVALYKS